MTKGEKALAALAAALLLLAAVCRFALPGVRFSAALFTALAALCVLAIFLGRWAEKSRTGKTCQRIFLVSLAALLLSFFSVEGLLMVRGGEDRSALPAEAVIVLGAGVNGETPSLTLQTRIDAAAEYLRRHPDIPAVLSGGQGPGEAITEAEAMRRGLTAAGIGDERLILETASTSTAENFAYSKALLEQAGVDPSTAVIAVVSNDFHSLRAGVIARRAGLNTLSVSAKLPWWWLSANYYIREYFALVKTIVFD
ncbi:MAG: YdcF family protein [Oscillibacter sp.]